MRERRRINEFGYEHERNTEEPSPKSRRHAWSLKLLPFTPPKKLPGSSKRRSSLLAFTETVRLVALAEHSAKELPALGKE
jgi:hypothetical protein